MEMIVIAIVCFILGAIYNSGSGKKKLDTQIMSYLKLGKRVMIVVDNDATIFEKVGDKIQITKAITSFEEKYDGADELVPYDLVSGRSNEPYDSYKTDV